MDTAVWVAVVSSGCALLGVVVTEWMNRSRLKSWTGSQQLDIETSKRERAIMMRAQLACLRGLEELGCNGPVTRAIEELERFAVDEAHKGVSRLA